MRKLRAALTEAASHSRPTPTVMMALSDVRRRYDDLMERVADAPGSTLGQQLYNARIHAKLSAHEAANGFGLRRELPDELEEGATPTAQETPLVEQLIAAIRVVAGLDEGEFEAEPPPVEEHVEQRSGMKHWPSTAPAKRRTPPTSGVRQRMGRPVNARPITSR